MVNDRTGSKWQCEDRSRINIEGANKANVSECDKNITCSCRAHLKRLLQSLRLNTQWESYFNLSPSLSASLTHRHTYTHGCFHRQATNAKAGQTKGDAYVTAASGCYTTSMFTRTKRSVRTNTHDSCVTGAKGVFQISSHLDTDTEIKTERPRVPTSRLVDQRQAECAQALSMSGFSTSLLPSRTFHPVPWLLPAFF